MTWSHESTHSHDNEKTKRWKKVFGIIIVLAFIAFTVVIFFCIGKPLMQFVSEPSKFRLWVDQHGIWSRLAFIGMIAFQIIIAIIPGEPFEIGAGYAFGIWEGTLLCLVGSVIGSAIVYLFVRYCGIKAIELFFPKEKIMSLKFLQNTKKLNLIAFIIFLIPGTPKDILTYFIGLTPMKLSVWLLITATARIPSVITSTIGGDALGMENYKFAIIVFIITAVISIAGILIYRYIQKRLDKKHNETKNIE